MTNITLTLQEFRERDKKIVDRAEMKGAFIGAGMVFLLLIVSLL